MSTFLYLKFGTEVHMLDLLKNGTIYCSPLSYFAQQHKSSRFDTDELVVHISTKFDGKTILKNDLGVKMRVYSTQEKDVILNPIGNLYCLYSLNIANVPLNSYHKLHQQMNDFGSHVIIIKNSEEFMKRLFGKLDEVKMMYNRGLVKYVQMKDHDGKKDLFTKNVAYRHQKEFRIHLGTGLNVPYCFSIGNIEDIAAIEEVSNIKEISMDGNTMQLHLKQPSKY